jgi:methyl-accepting chemotaxis protein
MEGLSSNKEAREFIKKLDMAYGNYQGVFKQITQWDISKKLEKDLANAVAEVRDLAKSLNQLTETEILRYEKIGSRLTLTFLAVGLLAFIIIGGLIANSIVKPLNNVVHGLRDAAQQIERVIETITEISEQVSLLALNATIESARAGEAGKGFAVVAYEIKELAKQTANASGQIRQNIEAIQTSTTDSIKEINAISRVVGDVNQIVSTISAAIEEQSITTRDISENVAQASTAVNDISSEISMVTAASGRMSTSSTQVNSNSMELSKLARQLNTIVTRFKI